MRETNRRHRSSGRLSGVPGSGKSTLARVLAARVNKRWKAWNLVMGSIAVDIPMDGFHYSRAHLVSMPDPTTAIHRRGAACTFDAEAFHGLIQQLVRVPAQSLKAPSFDHAKKDPVENAMDIPASARIVLVEGNCCALNRRPWSDAAALMTELWYVDVPAEVAHRRVARRHLESGIVADEKAAWERATGMDEMDAREVRENRLPCDCWLDLFSGYPGA
ncbi:hypothetical protein ACJZ2D_012834 [Fusarium nematophilum]